MTDLGAVPASSTIAIAFTTNAADGSAVAPLSAFEAADVAIYKGSSTTPRSSTAGWTMQSPLNSVTGLHRILVDLSDNTDASFYAVGSFYQVVLSPDTETVDGKVVAAVIGSFRIVAAEGIAGKPKVDVDGFGGSAGTFASGIPEVKVASLAAGVINDAAFNADTGLTKVRGGTCQNGGSTTSAVLDAGASAVDQFYRGDSITFTSGTGTEYTRTILSYTQASKTVTFSPAIGATPDNTTVFVIRRDADPGAVQGAVASVSGSVGGNVNGNVVGSVASVAGDVGGNVVGSVGSVTGLTASDVGAIKTSVDDLPTNAELATALGTADDAVLAAIAALNNLSAAQVNAEVVDAVNVDTYAEPSGVVPATTTIVGMLKWLKALARNRRTQTSTTETLFADDGTTPIATSAKSDAAGTFTRGEWA